ncbi:hypothetical protein ACFL1H_05795 [Nanoarchaeota archaeon]
MISIIGGGPVGSYLANLLLKKGTNDIHIYEEHKKIGIPVQCSGLLTKDIYNYFKTNELKKLSKVDIYYNKDKLLSLNIDNYVFNRTKFDQHIINTAIDKGAKLHLNNHFMKINKLGKSKSSKTIINVKDKSNNKINNISTNKLIGADGTLSKVAKESGLWKKRIFYHGIQATVKLKNDSNTFNAYFGDIAPKFFAWTIPVNKTKVRAGVITLKNSRHYFDNFLKQIKVKKILDKQSGLIPIYQPFTKIKKYNTFLIGDAATQLKPTTGGGIVPGFRFAHKLSKSIIQNKPYSNFDKDLFLSLKIRQVLNHMRKRDFEMLVDVMKNPKIKFLIKKFDRDKVSKYMFKTLSYEPRLMKFILKNFYKLIFSNKI